MLIRRIIGAITPKSIKMRLTQRNFTQVANVADNADEFLLKNHPELVEKRRAVEAFCSGNGITYIMNRGETNPSYANLLDTSVGTMLENCGDNISKIKYLLGDYGLAKYAEISPAKVIKNRNMSINEIAYNTDRPFSYYFGSYMLNNKAGNLQELFTRFGECGRVMYKGYSQLGFVSTGFGTYELSQYGERMVRTSTIMSSMGESMDGIIKALS